MTTDGHPGSSTPQHGSQLRNADRERGRGETQADSEDGAEIVEEFLERDILPPAVADAVSRHHAAGDHREALRVIVESRDERLSR